MYEAMCGPVLGCEHGCAAGVGEIEGIEEDRPYHGKGSQWEEGYAYDRSEQR
jgi:hypothetical protein